MAITTVNLEERFGQFEALWTPKVIARVDDYDVKIAKVEGSFVWHQHDTADELFVVIAGRLTIAIEGQEDVVLGPGELAVIPRGTPHCPRADELTQILLFEQRSVVNTGDVVDALTVDQPEDLTLG